METINIKTASMTDLVSFYNANSVNTISRFADRKIAERRVQKLLDELIANDRPASADDGTVYGFDIHGLTRCPACGCHLSNGIGEHNQEVNGKHLKHDKFMFCCLGCETEFGPAIAKYVIVRKGAPVIPRPAMVDSLKLDRRIVSIQSGIVYKNACQVWKAGLVSAAQGDRLSAVLYGAAKKGDRSICVEINGLGFELFQK